MPIIQFRVHPSVGIARMGNSATAYYLASEFPQFMQEQFEHLRLSPKPRSHPRKFFGADTTSASATGTVADFNVYETNGVTPGNFKEANGKNDTILPQAVRFRVFAYVYASASDDARHPFNVFEVTSAEADISWNVNLANKKAKKTTEPKRDPDENLNTTPVDISTAGAPLTCFRIRPKAGLPNLAYAFLERDDTDKTKVTGRLHVIGNEGEFLGAADPKSMWADDWHDSAGDGSVEASVVPKNGGALLRAKLGTTDPSPIQYFDQDQPAPQDSTLGSIKAVPAWVVVGCPDYSPDMGHFISLWDLAVSQAIYNVEDNVVIDQPGKHRLVKPQQTESYKHADYLIHIHPHLCLFKDVRFVSGETFGKTENMVDLERAHNKTPPTTTPPPTGTTEQVRAAQVERGGIVLDARDPEMKKALAKGTSLKDPDPTKPIGEWLKIALVERLRRPGTLYRKKRKFQTKLSGGDSKPVLGMFPRKLGRRIDYDGGPDKGKFFEEPAGARHNGSLRDYHGLLKDFGKLCGGEKSPPKLLPPHNYPPGYDDQKLGLLDDMYWPATSADMPLLFELAFTHLQYDNFLAWVAPDADVRAQPFFDTVVPPSLQTAFGTQTDVDDHFAKFLHDQPTFAPAMIDMAHLGSVLGGSFLPGIEVGREGAIATNWCLFHGGTSTFPDVRFKPARKTTGHTLGTLTKDLAVPWTGDFLSCDEAWWPTARPGAVTLDGSFRTRWMIFRGTLAATLGLGTMPYKDYIKEYWKHVGFVRRDASNNFFDQEQSWHGQVDITLTDTGGFETNTNTYAFPPKLIGSPSADRFVLVGVTVRRSTGPVKISSVKIATREAFQFISETDGNTCVAIYGAGVETASIADIVVNVDPAAEHCGISVYRISGIKSRPVTSFTRKGGTLSGTLDVFANGAAVAIAYTDAQATFTWAGLTQDTSFNTGHAWQQSSASQKFTATQTGLAISATPTTAASQVMVAVSWTP